MNVDERGPVHDFEWGIPVQHITVNGEQGAFVIGQLDRQVDPSLHAQLIADDCLESRPRNQKIPHPKRRFFIEFLEDGQSQRVQFRRLDTLVDRVQKFLLIVGIIQSKLSRSKVSQAVAHPIERLTTLYGQDDVTLL